MRTIRLIQNLRSSTIAVVTLGLALSACSSGGSSGGASGTGVSFSLPSSVSVIQATSNTSSKIENGAMAVYDGAGTDYSTVRQDFDRVNHPVAESLSTVKEIMCFIGLLGAGTMWDDTKLPRVYLVGVDDSTCSSSSGQPTQGASSGGSGTSAKELKMVTVRLSREAPGGFPRMEIWFTESKGPGDSPMEIRANADVLQAPDAATAPSGRFNLNFSMASTTGTVFGRGSLVMSNSPSPISYTFYENMGAGGFSQTRGAAVEQKADGTGLKAAVQYSQSGGGGGSDAGAWVVATNLNSVKANNKKSNATAATTVSEIDLTGGICLSLQNFKYRIYGYGLFSEADGSVVNRNTGVGCKYTDNSGASKNCYIGKQGAWFERETSGSEHTLADGDTVTRQEWGSGAANNGQALTIAVKAGKLTKYTVRQYTLTEIAGVELRYFDSGTEYIVAYNPAGGGGAGFYKTDSMSWGSSGPSKTAITPVLLSFGANSFNFFYSEAYGSVTYVGGKSYVIAREEKTILPTSTDISGSAGLSLKCLNRCINGTLSSGDITTSWDTPYTNPANVGAAIDYYFEKSSMKLFLGTSNSGTEVKLGTGVSFSASGSKFTWGIDSGAMVTSTAGLANPWSIYDSAGSSFYQYRMGPNSWDKLILVSNSSGVLEFEEPLAFSYTHSTANDRNGGSEYDGKKFLLRYRGLGQMEGLPWDQIDRDGDGTPDMWLPRVALKDGIQMVSGGTNYRIKAMFGEKTLTNTGANCSDLATLSLPATAVPTAVSANSSNTSTSKPDHGTCTYAYETKTAAGCN